MDSAGAVCPVPQATPTPGSHALGTHLERIFMRRGTSERLLRLSIEFIHWHLAQVEVLNASKIDCCNGIALGISTLAEGVNAALGAEVMLDNVLVKSVRAGGGLWSPESQRCSGNKPEERCPSGADGAIAGEAAVNFAVHVEGYRTAVATTGMCSHGCLPHKLVNAFETKKGNPMPVGSLDLWDKTAMGWGLTRNVESNRNARPAAQRPRAVAGP